MDKYGLGGKEGFIQRNPNKEIRYLRGLNLIFHKAGWGFVKKGVVKRRFERPPLETYSYENFPNKTMTGKQVKRILKIMQNSEGLNLSSYDGSDGLVYRVTEQIRFEPMPEDSPDADRLKKQGLINIFKKEQPIIQRPILTFSELQLFKESNEEISNYIASQKPKVRVIKRDRFYIKINISNKDNFKNNL